MQTGAAGGVIVAQTGFTSDAIAGGATSVTPTFVVGTSRPLPRGLSRRTKNSPSGYIASVEVRGTIFEPRGTHGDREPRRHCVRRRKREEYSVRTLGGAEADLVPARRARQRRRQSLGSVPRKSPIDGNFVHRADPSARPVVRRSRQRATGVPLQLTFDIEMIEHQLADLAQTIDLAQARSIAYA